MMWAKINGLDTESVLQISQFPFSSGGSTPNMGSLGFPNSLGDLSPPDFSSCIDDCSCDHLEYLQGEYVISDFFPANGKAETWCFPDMYVTQTCITVTCSTNGTWCDFGGHAVDRMALAGPSDTALVVKARYEPDFFNFSVGLALEGLQFQADTLCALDDGTPCVYDASGASLSVMDVAEQTTTVDLEMPQCFEATLVPTPSPTPSPEPPPALSPTPSPLPNAGIAGQPVAPQAHGDPHCTNMRGEHFEVYKRGKLNMVTIPQGSSEGNADFSIVVVVTPTWWKKCAASFITLAVVMRESSCERITIRPGDGLMPAVEKVLNFEKSCNQTSTLEEIGDSTVMLRVGNRKVKFWQTTKYDKYLNMEVYGLDGEKQKVGGILGIDEHEDEAEVPEECKGSKRGLSLEAGSFAVTSISFARVM